MFIDCRHIKFIENLSNIVYKYQDLNINIFDLLTEGINTLRMDGTLLEEV